MAIWGQNTANFTQSAASTSVLSPVLLSIPGESVKSVDVSTSLAVACTQSGRAYMWGAGLVR
jgi:hypothetical protein